MASYGGWIKDSSTGAPIPRATAESWNNGRLIHRTIANDSGYFTISAFIPATSIRVSSVGYKTAEFPASTAQMLYQLDRDIRVLPPVVLPPGGPGLNNKWTWIIAIAAVALIASQKK